MYVSRLVGADRIRPRSIMSESWMIKVFWSLISELCRLSQPRGHEKTIRDYGRLPFHNLDIFRGEAWFWVNFAIGANLKNTLTRRDVDSEE
jgi:hypothetical protein